MSTLGIILVILLVVILLGGVGGDRFGLPYGYGGGHYGIGVVGIVLIVVIILLLTGRI
jgi:hypothetical protein